MPHHLSTLLLLIYTPCALYASEPDESALRLAQELLAAAIPEFNDAHFPPPPPSHGDYHEIADALPALHRQESAEYDYDVNGDLDPDEAFQQAVERSRLACPDTFRPAARTPPPLPPKPTKETAYFDRWSDETEEESTELLPPAEKMRRLLAKRITRPAAPRTRGFHNPLYAAPIPPISTPPEPTPRQALTPKRQPLKVQRSTPTTSETEILRAQFMSDIMFSTLSKQ